MGVVLGYTSHFAMADDGTITARAGSQLNCAGIARIRARITGGDRPGIRLLASEAADWEGGEYGSHVPGSAMPSFCREAVYEGAKGAYAESGLAGGIEIELIDALVHPVDANRRVFRAAGAAAVLGWIERLE